MTRRVFDLIMSVPLLIILLPFLIIVALWIKLDSRGPVFFFQTRIGRFGRTFRIYKFRTMADRPHILFGQITIGADPRITRCGKFLRKNKIDELPQLINIVKGDMSLVGPRPEVPQYVELYTIEQRRILNYRPGITSPASIAFNNESDILAKQTDPESFYRTKLIPKKIGIDLEYTQNATIRSDAAVILRTLFRVLR